MTHPKLPLALLACGVIALTGCATAQETASPAVREGGAPARQQGGTGIQQAAAAADSRLVEAREHLEQQRVSEARPPIEAALEELARLEEELPGGAFSAALHEMVERLESEPGSVDFGALRRQTEEIAAQLEPAVVRAVEDARYALLAGNPEQSIVHLNDAGVALGADTQRLPVQRLRAQLDEALELLGNRDVRSANRLLGQAQGRLAEVRAQAPLAPVRWKLREAAQAADGDDWQAAERLLADSVELLETMRQPGDEALAPGIEELEAQARTYLQQLDGGERPSPAELRNLASRTLDVRAG